MIVGNEPNLNRFWLPQFNPDGTDAAAPAYLALLARSYDALKAVDPAMRVWGGALAPRGVDRPGTGRDTHSPVAFLKDMGTAYRASGRTLPIMDGLAFHPYADSSGQSPDTPHPNSTTIGLADYDRLIQTLATAFDGSAQAGSALPVLYDEFGVESQIPAGKAKPYTGAEPATTSPVDEITQGAYYAQALQLAFCQPNVIGILLFHSQDEPRSRAGSRASTTPTGRRRRASTPSATRSPRPRRLDRPLRRARARRHADEGALPDPGRARARRARGAVHLLARLRLGAARAARRDGRDPLRARRATAAPARPSSPR